MPIWNSGWPGVVKAALLALLLSGPALAQDLPAALGRISYAAVLPPGGAICTAVLVAPDLALTAGHCVRGSETDASRLRVDLAWQGDRPGWRARGQGVLLVQGPPAPGLAGLAQDMALIRLKTPVPRSVAVPMPVSDALPAASAVLPLIAFRRDAPTRPAPPVPCRVAALPPALIGFDCPVVSGNSGAPVLIRAEGTWQVAGTFVAASQGPVRAWALRLPAWLRASVQAANVSHAKQ